MEEALIKRTMPNSLESEQSVVGSMIMDRDAILTASEILTKDDFYHQQYGVLFEAIVELYNSGQPVDLSPCRISCGKRMCRRKWQAWNISVIWSQPCR